MELYDGFLSGGHVFYPGLVVRKVVIEGEKVFIQTIGVGNGPFAALNDNKDLATRLWSWTDSYIKSELSRGIQQSSANGTPPIECFLAGTPILMADGRERVHRVNPSR
jgi:hypothetical protein